MIDSHIDSPDGIQRRAFLRRSSLFVVAALAARGAVAHAQPPKSVVASGAAKGAPKAIIVYKDPNCGCCAKWVEHLRAAGFTPTVHDTADMATVKSSMGVPEALHSCHTARAGTYTIEGHVPADLITRLLAEAPVARGLAVPGMPMGSPGMEGPTKDKYDVMIFDKSGKSKVYASR